MSTTMMFLLDPLPDPKKQKINDDKDMRTLLREQHSSQYDLKWVEELHQQMMDFWTFYHWLLTRLGLSLHAV